jgi:hypothetical protein
MVHMRAAHGVMCTALVPGLGAMCNAPLVHCGMHAQHGTLLHFMQLWCRVYQRHAAASKLPHGVPYGISVCNVVGTALGLRTGRCWQRLDAACAMHSAMTAGVTHQQRLCASTASSAVLYELRHGPGRLGAIVRPSGRPELSSPCKGVRGHGCGASWLLGRRPLMVKHPWMCSIVMGSSFQGVCNTYPFVVGGYRSTDSVGRSDGTSGWDCHSVAWCTWHSTDQFGTQSLHLADRQRQR